MPEYAGSALYLSWVYSGGTVVPSGNFRTFTTTPSVDLYEATAGADAYKIYLPGVKDGQIAFSYVDQADGTAMTNAFAPGTEGTLTVGPEGTASGKPREIYPAIAMGAARNEPYNNVVEISVPLQQNGADTKDNY